MLLAFFHLGDGHRTPSGRNRALFLLSAAGYAVSSTPDFARLDAPLRFPLLVASLGVPALLWISAAAVFDDKFEPSWRRGLAWVGLVVLGLWSVFDSQPPVTIGYYAVSLLFVALPLGTHSADGGLNRLMRGPGCLRHSPLQVLCMPRRSRLLISHGPAARFPHLSAWPIQ